MRRIAWFMIAAAVVTLVVSAATGMFVQLSMLPPAVHVELASVVGIPLPGVSFMFGLALGAFAEILRRGAAMREELEGVI